MTADSSVPRALPDPARPMRPNGTGGPVAPLDAVPVHSPGLASVVIDGSVVVLDRDAGTSALLNPTAALVWAAVDGRRSVRGVVDHLALETAVDRAVLLRDVPTTIGELEAVGVVRRRGAPADAPPSPLVPARPTAASRWAPAVRHRLDRWEGWRAIGPVTLGDATVEVRTNDPALATRVARALGSLPQVPTIDDGVVLWVIARSRGGSPRYRVVLDGELVLRAATEDAALSIALATLNRHAVATTTGRILLHAGAVERDGEAIVIAGRSGRGKSTLTAALVRRGYRYLTDEMAIIDPVTGWVDPYAKALDLDPRARRLLSLAGADETASTAKAGVPPTELGAVSAGGRLGLLVLLDPPGPPAAAAEPPLARLEPPAALVRLLPNAFAATLDLPNALDVLARLCRTTPVHRLDRRPIAEAVAAIDAARGA